MTAKVKASKQWQQNQQGPLKRKDSVYVLGPL